MKSGALPAQKRQFCAQTAAYENFTRAPQGADSSDKIRHVFSVIR